MSLKYNLQFFAKDGPGGEKTEEPTSKKLEDARKEGQVSKSKEISNCVGLFSLFIVLKIFVGSMGNRFLGMFNIIYTKIPETVVFYEGNVPVTTIVSPSSLLLTLSDLTAVIFNPASFNLLIRLMLSGLLK